MNEEINAEKDARQDSNRGDSKLTPSGTIMTHLMTYRTPGGKEFRLHDAEYKGKHYFDYRKYDQRTRGASPTKSGLRAGPKDLEFLEDAMMRWRRYYKQVIVREAKREA